VSDEKLSDADLDRLIKGAGAHNDSCAEEEKKKKTADKLIELAVEKSYHDDGRPVRNWKLPCLSRQWFDCAITSGRPSRRSYPVR